MTQHGGGGDDTPERRGGAIIGISDCVKTLPADIPRREEPNYRVVSTEDKCMTRDDWGVPPTPINQDPMPEPTVTQRRKVESLTESRTTKDQLGELGRKKFNVLKGPDSTESPMYPQRLRFDAQTTYNILPGNQAAPSQLCTGGAFGGSPSEASPIASQD